MHLAQTIKQLLAPAITAMGYEFVGCEWTTLGRGRTLCVFIDSPKGISVDDCGEVSRQISAIFAVEDPIDGPYQLEVSSPGLERPLFELAHYQQFIGERIAIQLRQPQAGRKRFTGTIDSVDGEQVTLIVDTKPLTIKFGDIQKGHLAPL